MAVLDINWVLNFAHFGNMFFGSFGIFLRLDLWFLYPLSLSSTLTFESIFFISLSFVNFQFCLKIYSF